MQKETEYRLRKRIKELQADNNRLQFYERAAKDIYNTIAELVKDNKTISQGWILYRLGSCLK